MVISRLHGGCDSMIKSGSLLLNPLPMLSTLVVLLDFNFVFVVVISINLWISVCIIIVILVIIVVRVEFFVDDAIVIFVIIVGAYPESSRTIDLPIPLGCY